MEWNFVGGLPIWSQLCDKIKRGIILGEYKPNEKIPGVREFAAMAQVNPNTMQRALVKLEEEGIVVTRGTGGRFVCADEKMLLGIRRNMLEGVINDYFRKCAELGVTHREAIEILEEEADNIG